MRKFILVTALLFISYAAFSLTFRLFDSPDTPFSFQINLETGVAIEGAVNTGTGRTDYNTVFLRPSLYIERFGIGFNLRFRFSNYPELFEFKDTDWESTGDTVKDLYQMINKLDFISYGDPQYFVYVTTGTLPYLSAGTGLLIDMVHNSAFAPVFSEHGVYSKFDGDAMKYKIPFKGYFFLSDVADPDLFLAGGEFQFDRFFPSDLFGLTVGTYGAADLDPTESTLLSATTLNEITYYRDTDYEGSVLAATLPIDFTYRSPYADLHVFSESAVILKDSGDWEGAEKFGVKLNVIQIEDSGYLLGIPLGLTIKTDGFYPGYFSFNYEIVRKSQYETPQDDRNFFFNYGLYLNGFNNTLNLAILLSSPLVMTYYTAIYEGSFTFKGAKGSAMEGFDIGVRYKTALSQLNITGSGGYFLNSITKDFRFCLEIGYTLYATAIHFFIGAESPYWIASEEDYYIDDEDNTIDSDKLGNLIEKFMRVEVSFAF